MNLQTELVRLYDEYQIFVQEVLADFDTTFKKRYPEAHSVYESQPHFIGFIDYLRNKEVSGAEKADACHVKNCSLCNPKSNVSQTFPATTAPQPDLDKELTNILDDLPEDFADDTKAQRVVIRQIKALIEKERK